MSSITVLPERTDWDIQGGLVRVARIRCELIYVGKNLLNNGRETFIFWFYSNCKAAGLDTKGWG